MLLCTLEVFFACFGVAIIFQSASAMAMQGINFASWHLLFAVLMVGSNMLLIYKGIRREFNPVVVTPAIIIAYAAYLTYPFAAQVGGISVIPWCTYFGLYGLLTPLTLGTVSQAVGHIIGFPLALLISIFGASAKTGIKFYFDEVIPHVLLLLIFSIMLTFLFSVARYYADNSDVLYTETLSAQLQFNRSKDKSVSLQEFDKLVHDNVMAALLDASRVEGPIADRTRALARRAITVIEDETNRVSPEGISTFQSLTEQIAVGVAPWNSRLRFVEDGGSNLPKADPDSEIPHAAARAFTHAVTEAVSNSARHSGTRTTQISVRTEMRRAANSSRSDEARPYIFCTVSDRGAGFDMKNLDLRRMGVRVSMIRSMEEAGGKVTIKSAPDRGTVVVVQWPGEK